MDIKLTRRRLNFLSLLLIVVATTIFFSFSKSTGDGDGDGTGNSYALLIGIDNYMGSDWSPLKTPVSDAKALEDLLLDKYGFKEVVSLYNEDATREKIIDYLDRIAQNVAEDDNLLIFFSGHGVELGNEGYWVPSDAEGQERYELIPNSEVKAALHKTNSKHVLVMVDACFSSTIFKSSNLFLKNDGSDDYYEKVGGLMSRQAITAGGLEPVPDGNGEHSVFAKYLLKYLSKNEKKQLDASELYEMLKYPVAANSPNMPQFGHIQNTGHEGGQFVFRLADTKTCAFEGVTIEEGEKITFGENGGKIHAVTPEKNVTYEWIKGSVPLENKSPELEVKERGLYTVIITSEDGTCTDVAVIDVDISLPDIDVNIMEGADIQFTHQGVLHAEVTDQERELDYEWRKNNFIIGKKPQLRVRESGVYTVTIKLKDGRPVSSSTTKVEIRARTYEVKIGDTMERIALKFYGDANKKGLLYAANDDKVNEGDILRVGTILVVPPDERNYTPTTQLKIAAFESFAPFSKVGAYNDGMMTEIVRKTFDEMAQDIYVDFMSGNKAKAVTFSGRFAASFPVPKNENDEKLFLFSDPLYKILNVLFVKKDSEIVFEKDRNLKGLRIAIARGFYSDKLNELANKRIVGVLAYDTVEECFKMLEEGKVDVVAVPQMVGLMTLHGSTELKAGNFKMLDNSLESNTLHLVISKENPDSKIMMHEFNTAFRKLQEQGVVGQIQNTHIDKFQSSL